VVLDKDRENQVDAGVKNLEVLHRVKKERNTQLTVKEGRLTGLVTSCGKTAF
jgi:hypothetical protein